MKKVLKKDEKYKIKVNKVYDSNLKKDIVAITIHEKDGDQLSLPLEVNEENKYIVEALKTIGGKEIESIYESIDDKTFTPYKRGIFNNKSKPLPEKVTTCVYETDFKRHGEGQLYKTYLFEKECPPLQDILRGKYKNFDKKLYNVELHQFTKESKENHCNNFKKDKGNPNSICYEEEPLKRNADEPPMIGNNYVLTDAPIDSTAVVGGKKRKRKTVRKRKKSKSVRKHKKAG